jgi:hypothetical protein
MLKMVVVAEIPSASVSTAVAVSAGLRASERTANRKSCRNPSIAVALPPRDVRIRLAARISARRDNNGTVERIA